MGVKVLTVIGTRPEAIKLFPLIHTLEADPRFESSVCLTGQHRELVGNVLALAGVTADHDFDLMQASQSLDAITAGVLTGMSRIFESERPDWVVVQGDTTSAMAAALAAHHRHIPVCHVEAGLRSGNLANPWPEEANRKIIAALATLHCAPTETAAAALVAENVDGGSIHVTGNTGIDALRWARARLGERPDLAPVAARLERRFIGRRMVTATLHRRESWGPPMAALASALAELAAREDIAIALPVHPNPVVGTILRERLGHCENVALVEALGYYDFVRLLSVSAAVLTDSGGVQEEAATLGVPVLVLRETTERSEAVSAGNARVVGLDPCQIVSQLQRLLDDQRIHAEMARASSCFGDGNAAPRIAALLDCLPVNGPPSQFNALSYGYGKPSPT